MAPVANREMWFPFSEQSWTLGGGVYSPKTADLDVSETDALSFFAISRANSMSARDRIAFIAKIVSKFNLHLKGGIVRHWVQMRVELGH